MSRYTNPTSLDDAAVADGDGGWLGVNDRVSPELLADGWARSAVNLECVGGCWTTRRGLTTPAWGRVGVTPPLFGAGVFRDPVDDVEWIVLVGAAHAWLVRDGGTVRTLGLPGTVDTACEVRQAFDRLFILRAGKVPWELAGTVFAEVAREDLSDGTHPMPLAGTAELLNDRLWVVDTEAGDVVRASDLLDYTRYGLLAEYAFNKGKDDRIVRLFPFTQDTLLVFKDKSIFALTGATGDLSGASVELVNAELGCAAAGSVCAVGADAVFLSPQGVFRVSQVVENRLGTPPTAVSKDIPGLMGRINRAVASQARAVVSGDYYYLAVALDRAASNNAILCHNLNTGAWEGVHTYGIQLDRLLIATVGGQPTPVAVDFATGGVHVLYVGGSEDLFYPSGMMPGIIKETTDIAAELVTRGFRGSDAAPRKQWRAVQLDVGTRATRWTAEILTDGVAEGATLAPDPITRDRTRNLNGTKWAADNAGDDHGLSGRADYGVILTPTPMQLGDGVVLNRVQEFTERFPVRARGRWAQLRIASTRGTLAIRAVGVEGTQADRGYQQTQ